MPILKKYDFPFPQPPGLHTAWRTVRSEIFITDLASIAIAACSYEAWAISAYGKHFLPYAVVFLAGSGLAVNAAVQNFRQTNDKLLEATQSRSAWNKVKVEIIGNIFCTSLACFNAFSSGMNYLHGKHVLSFREAAAGILCGGLSLTMHHMIKRRLSHIRALKT